MLKVYDPTKVSVIVGATALKGFAEGGYIKIDYEGNKYSEVYDSRGTTMVRIKQADKGTKITITLTQGSQSNDMLSALAEADRLNDSGVFDVFIKDGNGTSLFTGLECFIAELPQVEYSNENTNREWVIRVPRVQQFIGGY